MENIEIKEMEKEKRRNLLLAKLQYAANNVLWSIRDDDPDIMVDIQNYKRYYRIYRNIKRMEGQAIYSSPKVDINLICKGWEDY